jgi:hypothetical protein
MVRGRNEVAAFAVAAAVALGVASPAMAGTGAGTFSLARQAGGASPAARADWTLDGVVLAARAEAPLVGLTADKTLIDTDSRYVHAMLRSAHQDPVVTDCGDGTGGTTTEALGGVASAGSVFEVALSLNRLHGRGTAQVGVAESPWPGNYGIDFAPGVTNATSHSTCYGTVDDRSGTADIIHDGEQAMFPALVGERANQLTWRLTRAARRTWRMQGTRHLDVGGVYTVSTSVTFAGTPVSLHARCVMPTVHDLAPARTLKQARRIVARAGFSHIINARAKMTKAAHRGRYYIDEGVGNRDPVRCGYRRLHLVRSQGWPSI